MNLENGGQTTYAPPGTIVDNCIIIDDIRLRIKKLKKKVKGFGAVYATKIITDYLDCGLGLDELMDCFSDNAKWTAPEDFEQLEKLGIKSEFYCSIEDVYKLLVNNKPLIYLDSFDKSCGVICGFNEKKIRIFDLKKEREVNPQWFNRIDSVIELKKALKKD